MSSIPVLMVLYSSDAVEIRYSDGSRLELSPCGSTMIYCHGSARGEHPLHKQSKRIQKRTRFVTSAHRSKVLQALDFRNRFAERPYLCEELMQREDILALYAKIDGIAWPKTSEEAKVEVLSDGSRRITSVDEYASLVVSPHRHDFTVCYLSTISEDKVKSRNPFSQTKSLMSSNSSRKLYHPQSHTERYPDEMKERDAKSGHKSNEAVVHPFAGRDHLNNADSSNREPHKDLKNASHSVISGKKSNRNFGYLDQESNFPSERSHQTQCQQEGPVGQCLPSETVLSDTFLEDSAQKQGVFSSKACMLQSQNGPETDLFVMGHVQSKNSSPTNSVNSGDVPKEQDKNHHAPHVSGKQPEGNPPIGFPTGSPNSHEISSISRSSTPDGLRTWVDSDATLSHDNTSGTCQGKRVVYKHRHSSPTQYTSSPYEIQNNIKPQRSSRSADNSNISLSGSFLGNQMEQEKGENFEQQKFPVCEDQLQSSHNKSNSTTIRNSGSTMSEDSLQLQTTKCDISNNSSQQPSRNSVSYGKTLPLNNAPPAFCGSPKPTDNCSNNIKLVTSNLKATSISHHLPTENEFHSSMEIPPKQMSDVSESYEIEKARKCRYRYVWTTKHVSRNDCPVLWAHPLKLALDGKTLTSEDISSHPTLKRLQAVSTTFKANKEKCTLTSVPTSLPVTCPFQHIHKWSASGNPSNTIDESLDSDAGDFQHGRLRIVISEGIVYRLVHGADINVVEIHPGDGSILVSQGVKGTFFTHCVLVGDQLEERTYSLKSLPHGQPKGRYSIEKLIKTANRFLLMNSQWERRGLREDIPCWKKEIVGVVEPLSSSLLEECYVAGLGKFTAFTNGRVRIVFDDRAALDMVCNFSHRVAECLQHSQELQISIPWASSLSPPVSCVESIFGASTGRLLLPNGKYVTVDINNPGPYRKYIQTAQEWAAWVNSSPIERQQFYSQHHMPTLLKQAAEIELKKIFCFNYIVEQTMQMQNQGLDIAVSLPDRTTHINTTAEYGDLESKSVATPRSSPRALITNRSERFISSPSATFSSASHPTTSGYNTLESPRPACTHPPQSSRGHHSSDTKVQEIVSGFQSVRQVLLQNSNLISDIDTFLENSHKFRDK